MFFKLMYEMIVVLQLPALIMMNVCAISMNLEMNKKLFDMTRNYKQWGDYEELNIRLMVIEQKVNESKIK